MTANMLWVHDLEGTVARMRDFASHPPRVPDEKTGMILCDLPVHYTKIVPEGVWLSVPPGEAYYSEKTIVGAITPSPEDQKARDDFKLILAWIRALSQ